MYLFLSGYGLCKSTIRKDKFTIKDSIKKMFKFLKNYWVVFIIFVPIGLIWFRGDNGYHLSIVEFLSNFFTLSSSYNHEWWFVRLYIELLLLSKNSILAKVFYINLSLASYIKSYSVITC